MHWCHSSCIRAITYEKKNKIYSKHLDWKARFYSNSKHFSSKTKNVLNRSENSFNGCHLSSLLTFVNLILPSLSCSPKNSRNNNRGWFSEIKEGKKKKSKFFLTGGSLKNVNEYWKTDGISDPSNEILRWLTLIPGL